MKASRESPVLRKLFGEQRPCKHCGQAVTPTATRCSHCDGSNPFPLTTRDVLRVLALVIAVAAVFGLFDRREQSSGVASASGAGMASEFEGMTAAELERLVDKTKNVIRSGRIQVAAERERVVWKRALENRPAYKSFALIDLEQSLRREEERLAAAEQVLLRKRYVEGYEPSSSPETHQPATAPERTPDRMLDEPTAERGRRVFENIASEGAARLGVRAFYQQPVDVSLGVFGGLKLVLHVPSELWNALPLEERQALPHYCESWALEHGHSTWEIVLGRVHRGDVLYDKKIVSRFEWQRGLDSYRDWSW